MVYGGRHRGALPVRRDAAEPAPTDDFAPGRQRWSRSAGALLGVLVLAQAVPSRLGGLPVPAPLPEGYGGYRELGPRALHRLRIAGGGGVAAAHRRDRRRADAGQAEDRLSGVPIEHVIGLSAILFTIGVIGVVTCAAT